MNPVKNWKIVAIIAAILVGICTLAFCSIGGDDTNPTASPVIPIEVNEDDQMVFETMPPIEAPDNLPGLYANNKTLSCTDRFGGVLSVGMTYGGMDDTFLALYPSYSSATPTNKVGYYISSVNNSCIHTYTNEYLDTDAPEIINASNVVIDWTYDKLLPAQYSDTCDGVYWTPQIGAGDNGDTIHIVAIDLTTHKMLSSMSVDVIKSEAGVFELANLRDNDVRSCGVNVDYQKLYNMAVSNIYSGDLIVTTEQFNINNSIIECVTDKIYTLKYLTRNKEINYRGKINYPVYAVTVNSVIPQVGHITQYYTVTGETVQFIGSGVINPENMGSVAKYEQ